jgi:Cu+-exporting ATPase
VEQKQTAIKIGGMHCAGCVNSIQRHVSNLDGVKKCEVNLATQKAFLEFDPSVVDLAKISKAVQEAGYLVISEKLDLKITGMTDSADASTLEKKLRQVEAIKDVSANYGNGQIQIEYNPALLSLADIRQLITKNGYQIQSEILSESAEEIDAKKLKKLFLLGLGFTIPIMVFGYPEYLSFVPFTGTNISAYVMFGCASIVQFLAGSRFYTGAYRIAKLRSANMDTLVILGTTAAYLFSAYNTFPVPIWHNIYYDASALVVTFIVLGKYLENKTKGKTSSLIKKMLELSPKTATIRRNGQEIEIPVDHIKQGDIIVVRPGQKIPVDSIVIEGNSTVDQSMITGESMPVGKCTGDQVMGATINKEGMLLIKADKVGRDTILSQIVKLVEDAMGKKPPMQKLVDKIAGYFAFFVIAAAVVTFLGWYLVPDGEHHFAASLIPAVAILVVACPCALGLATPTAVMVGMSKSAQNGVIFKNGEALEALSKIQIMVFDKTGTLTEGKPQVTDIFPLNSTKDHVLQVAAAIEANSEHPLAKAIVERAKQSNLELGNVSDFIASPGRGIEARYNDSVVVAGKLDFVAEKGIDIKAIQETASGLHDQGKTTVIIASNSVILGIIALLDVSKPTARDTITDLRQIGIKTVMLSGDNLQTATTVANQIGIDHVIANVLPHQKVEVIKQLQKEGRVAMIGDGINDAAALAEANVGIAVASGTDIAIEAGGIILIGSDPYDTISAIQISKKTVSKIKQNLFYAFAYNIALIPLAGLGLLYPALAGLAMAASSVSVTTSSLLLKRWSPKIKSSQ